MLEVLQAVGTGVLVEVLLLPATLAVMEVEKLVETAVAVVPTRRAMVVRRLLADPILIIIIEIIMQETMALLEQGEMR